MSGDKNTAYTCQQSTMDGGKTSGGARKEIGNGTDVRNSRVIRCAVLDITNPLNAKLTAEKYYFASPVAEHPKAGQGQKDIKVSAAYWLKDEKVMLLERTTGLVRFMTVDFATGDKITGK